MNILRLILAIFSIVAVGTTAFSAKDPDKKATPGPKGGRVLATEPLQAEFFVQPDKRVSITFYDENMKPVAPSEQVVKVIAEAPSGKATLEFEKTSDGFVSTAPLPEGEGYRVVVQIKPAANIKPQNFRIDYHNEICGECKFPEYACICEDHSGAGHEKHAH
jgi:hypothetical protein